MANKKPCCDDMKAAQADDVILFDPGLGVCIQAKNGRVPIPHCPWCTKKQETGLYTSPAMSYRP
jgi:hypothetical protein